jgi:hypothetical protein
MERKSQSVSVLNFMGGNNLKSVKSIKISFKILTVAPHIVPPRAAASFPHPPTMSLPNELHCPNKEQIMVRQHRIIFRVPFLYFSAMRR